MQIPLPFALPDLGDEEIEAVTACIRSGWVSSGPKVTEFETAFADSLGGNLHAVALNSATAGLHLALEALGVGPGDEVLVPTWTFTATAEVVRYLGAVPVLVDTDPCTLNIDLVDADKKVTARTCAVMPVHFAGLPVAPSAVDQFAVSHRIHVVEDAAHAFPAASERVLVGAGTSAATVFSFYATKPITTGEGGMLVTRDAGLARRVRTMRLHGINRDAFDRYRSPSAAWHYEVVAPGYKYNLTDPAAAMGLVQLRRAESMRARREQIASQYDQAFDVTPLILPANGAEGTVHAWHLYVVRLPQGSDRNMFISELSRRGIGTSVHFIPLHLQPYWRDFGAHRPDDFPVATHESHRVVSLPIFSRMNDADVSRVIEAVLQVVPR
jgi:dTDP-4-amino-4,6-dideoxygalactose transaminase